MAIIGKLELKERFLVKKDLNNIPWARTLYNIQMIFLF